MTLAEVVGLAAFATAGGTIVAGHPRVSSELAGGLLRVMLYVFVPFVAFVSIGSLDISGGLGRALGCAILGVAVVGGVAALGGRALRLPRPSEGALICTVVCVNTGYLGVPLVVALRGVGQLPTAVAYDQLVSTPGLLVVGFGIGALYGERAGQGRERLASFLRRNPPLLASAAGLLIPRGQIPAAALHVSHAVVYAMLPLGFLALGLTLGSTRRELGGRAVGARHGVGAPVLGTVSRVLLNPLALLGVAGVLGGVPRTFLILSAMPTGINALAISHVFGLDRRLVARTIVLSTLACGVSTVVFGVW